MKNAGIAEDIRIPVLVGITGHRDIENEEELINNITKVLTAIGERYPETPIVLLTPLAEGADRAAAKAALALREINAAKYSCLVILPMEEEEYKETFANKESVREYEELKRQTAGCYQVPVSEALQIGSSKDKAQRQAILYANLGAYIALHTQILIAAWNGAEESDGGYGGHSNNQFVSSAGSSSAAAAEVKPGGTYHTLRTRFFGIDAAYRGAGSVFANREFGPVYWIRARRKSSPYLAEGETVAGPAYPDFPVGFPEYGPDAAGGGKRVQDYFLSQTRQWGKTRSAHTYDEILLKLNDYNADIDKMYPRLGEKINAAQKALLTYRDSQADEDKEQAVPVPAPETEFLSHYATADLLSQYYQSKRKNDIILLIALAFTGLLSFNLYSGPLMRGWFILAYSTVYLLGIAYYLYRVGPSKYHERYIDYRGIAEGIRVQFFWHLAGIETRVTDMYLTKQKSSIDWIRIAIDNSYLMCKAASGGVYDGVKSRANLSTVYRLWLLEQYNYYNRKWPEKDKGERRQKRAGKALFAVGLALAFALAGLDTYESLTAGTCGINFAFSQRISNGQYEVIHKWLVFAVGFLPVIIASYRVYTEFLAYAKLARSYNWMRMVYNIGRQEFEKLASDRSLDEEEFVRRGRKLLVDIGVEALLENGEWIGTLEERVPEMPQ